MQSSENLFSENSYNENSTNYKLIQTEYEANKILVEILQDKGCVIGVDIEAAVEMSRFGILCLLQIAYHQLAYIFDMTEIVFSQTLLKEIFMDNSIVKVFHDSSEDCSILRNMYKSEINNTFDTQIAHRLIYEAIHGSSMNTKHSSISLHDLLNEYLQINHSMKNEISTMMGSDPYFWKKRPLTNKMLDYTANDVLYLEKLYWKFKKDCEGRNNIKFDLILMISKNYLEYSNINLNIKNYNKISISKDKELQGLIKNFQKNCIYVQLNIGYNGIVTNKKTISSLKANYKLGDILTFKIFKNFRFDSSNKRYILEISEKQDKHILNKFHVNVKENLNLNNENDLCENNISNKKKSLNVNMNSFFPSFIKNNQIQTTHPPSVIPVATNVNNFFMFYPSAVYVHDKSLYTCNNYPKSTNNNLNCIITNSNYNDNTDDEKDKIYSKSMENKKLLNLLNNN